MGLIQILWLYCVIAIACESPNGLTGTHTLDGFYYSHKGYWRSGYTYQGSYTSANCAASCKSATNPPCVAIDTYVGSVSTNYCYHYHNLADIVDTNKRIHSSFEAYIKCWNNFKNNQSIRIDSKYDARNTHVKYLLELFAKLILYFE